MKDFENDLIYYPNPDPVKEPRFILKSVDELEKSTKYSVTCNGTERVVYHTDSFDYVVVVDNEAYDLEISIHTPYEKLEIRPSSFGIVPSVKGETVHIHLDEPRKFTVETDGGLHDALFATVYKGNIIKNLIMDCQSYTKYRPNETTGGIFVSWRRKEELPTGA